MSCSSVMSPTISSRMSSSVTSPSTSPYSSTTSANCVLRRRNALSCSDSGRMSGTNQGGSAIARCRSSARSPSASCSARSRSLACRMPTMFSGLSRHSGMRVTGLEHGVDDLLRRIVGIEGHHLGAMDHDVGHRRDRADRARRPSCRGRASRRRRRGAADRRCRESPRAATGSTASSPTRMPSMRRIWRTSHSIAVRTGRARGRRRASAARPPAPCGRAR